MYLGNLSFDLLQKYLDLQWLDEHGSVVVLLRIEGQLTPVDRVSPDIRIHLLCRQSHCQLPEDQGFDQFQRRAFTEPKSHQRISSDHRCDSLPAESVSKVRALFHPHRLRRDLLSSPIRGARAKASMLTMIGFWKRPWKYVSANITSTMIPIYCYVSDDQR
jgi:hypothetical protein